MVLVANHLNDELAEANERLSQYWAGLRDLAIWLGTCNCLLFALNIVAMVDLLRRSRVEKSIPGRAKSSEAGVPAAVHILTRRLSQAGAFSC